MYSPAAMERLPAASPAEPVTTMERVDRPPPFTPRIREALEVRRRGHRCQVLALGRDRGADRVQVRAVPSLARSGVIGPLATGLRVSGLLTVIAGAGADRNSLL